eukprot:363770-Chlamydomonas_euryale.AAC.10
MPPSLGMPAPPPTPLGTSGPLPPSQPTPPLPNPYTGASPSRAAAASASAARPRSSGALGGTSPSVSKRRRSHLRSARHTHADRSAGGAALAPRPPPLPRMSPVDMWPVRKAPVEMAPSAALRDARAAKLPPSAACTRPSASCVSILVAKPLPPPPLPPPPPPSLPPPLPPMVLAATAAMSECGRPCSAGEETSSALESLPCSAALPQAAPFTAPAASQPAPRPTLSVECGRHNPLPPPPPPRPRLAAALSSAHMRAATADESPIENASQPSALRT